MQKQLASQYTSYKAGSVTLVLMTSLSLFAQSPGTIISVDDPRPLAQALLQLEARTGVAINYEDGPYVFAADTEDVTQRIMSAEQKAANPGAHVLVPRGGKLTVALPLGINGSVDPSTVPSLVDWVLTSSNNKGFPLSHIVSRDGGAISVVPATGRDNKGAVRNLKPLFDTKVTLPFSERIAGEALDDIFRQVQKVSGETIIIGAVPARAMITERIQIGASDESARTVIVRLLSMIGNQPTGSGFSYHLYFDLQQRSYFFNAHSVQPISQVITPALKSDLPASTLPNKGQEPYTRRTTIGK